MASMVTLKEYEDLLGKLDVANELIEDLRNQLKEESKYVANLSKELVDAKTKMTTLKKEHQEITTLYRNEVSVALNYQKRLQALVSTEGTIAELLEEERDIARKDADTWYERYQVLAEESSKPMEEKIKEIEKQMSVDKLREYLRDSKEEPEIRK